MRFGAILKAAGPVLAVAATAGAIAGCSDGARAGFDNGVPLAELDLSGPAPRGVYLAGPDRVVVEPGERLTVRAEGEAADALRFALDEEALSVTRETGSSLGRSATVYVTMPAPRELTMAGSGTIESRALAPTAEISVAGSGRIDTPAVDATRLDVQMRGSATYRASGRAEQLELDMAGSGHADMGELQVDTADISVAGSGEALLASDGQVDANISGSGIVTVRGSARCTVSSQGSGKLVCERDEPAG